MKIITITLSPAFDVHCEADSLLLGHENLLRIIRREAGGKGVNISRALLAGDIDSLTVVVLGTENGEDFAKCLQEDGLCVTPIFTSGRIRENVTVHNRSGEETRFSFEVESTNASVLESLWDVLKEHELGDTFVTLTGRIPAGIPLPIVKELVRELQNRGARVIIDSRSFSLSDLAECTPYLIKPNEEEISKYMGKDVGSIDEAIEAASVIHDLGIENVMITLGGDGAVLVSDDGAWSAKAPSIIPISTIGAGDSSIAGFLSAISKGYSKAEALRAAVAYGSAACLTEGTRPPRKEDIERIAPNIKIERKR